MVTMGGFRKSLISIVLAAGLLACLLNACAPAGTADETKTGSKYIIGVSQANMREEWRIALIDELKEAADSEEDIQIITADATGSVSKQVQDIDNLINYGSDLIIISPVDEKKMASKIKEIYNKDVPVIVMDRAVEGFDYTLYIGPDNQVVGRQAGDYVANRLGDNGGRVVALSSKSMSIQGTERMAGFLGTMEENSQINVESLYMESESKDAAYDLICASKEKVERADIIFAYSDNVALGVCDALRDSGLEGTVQVVDCDGFKGEDEGMDLVKEGRLLATVSCPIGGNEAFDYAKSILKNESGVPKQVILRSTLITVGNINEALGQMDANYEDHGQTIDVGFSQPGKESNWRLANIKSVSESARAFNINLHMEYADQSQAKQFEAIRGFIDEGVDVIIVSPVVGDGWEGILTQAKDAGIPVIMSDRDVTIEGEDESLRTTYIGADFMEEGRRAMQWLRDNVPAKGKALKIMELKGNAGAKPTLERGQGFRNILNQTPGYEIEYSDYGDFTFEGGREVVSQYLDENEWDIDIIYAHNDDMALGAIEELKARGIMPDQKVTVISVDATKAAFESMVAGELSCSVECNPIIGDQLMKAVRDLVAGKKMPYKIITEEKVYDQSVAESLIKSREY
ncbi:MAG: substrate-binding domain-containing protein [Pseudobutyrivibrio sp.]|nr:substrate-binding domain-containing protein [Pseudobutyrivibrio sp.]